MCLKRVSEYVLIPFILVWHVLHFSLTAFYYAVHILSKIYSQLSHLYFRIPSKKKTALRVNLRSVRGRAETSDYSIKG